MAVALILPAAPLGSRWFNMAASVNGDLREEVGWQDLVGSVADIYSALPATERSAAGILTGNYGEAGAINLYGPARGLPQAQSRVNSYWLRGHPQPAPRTLILVGLPREFVDEHFKTCEAKGTIANPWNVANEETTVHKYLWVCRELREPWPVFWQKIKLWS